MSSLASMLGPVLGKVILWNLFGREVAQLGETALKFAAIRFTDNEDAKQAAKYVEEFGKSIASDIEEALKSDGANDEEMHLVGLELVAMLQKKPLAEVVVSAKLNETQIKRKLLEIGIPVGLSAREQGFYEFAVRRAASRLRRISPALESYGVERDEVILTTLGKLASRSEDVLRGQIEATVLLESVEGAVQDLVDQEEKDRDRYTKTYIQKIRGLLNYVEVLGLDDLGRGHSEARLDVAYLSLTVTGEKSLPSDFSDLLNFLIATSGRLIIEGGAGSGKSTLLRWAATQAPNIPKSVREFYMSSVESAGSEQFLSSLYSRLIDIPQFIFDSDEYDEVLKKTDSSAKFNFQPIVPVLSDKSFSLVDNVSAYRKLIAHHVGVIPSSSDDILLPSTTIPVLVRLRGVENHIPDVDELAQCISPTISRPPSGWLDAQLKDGQVLLLFDGVDEVPEEKRRAEVLQGIADYARTYPRATIIITTRPHAFAANAVGLDDFVVASVDDMSVGQQSRFVRNWHKARSLKLPEEQGRDFDADASALIERFETQSVLARLASNPLLCAAICALHEYSPETLPEDERTLCEKLTEMLVDKRDRTVGRDRAISLERFGPAHSMPYQKKKVILARLAVEMLRSGTSSLGIEDAAKIVGGAIKEVGQAELTSQDVLLALVVRSGVLRESSAVADRALDATVGSAQTETLLPEGVEFIHNRFKEWLASTFFVAQGTHGELAKRATEEGFDDACAFAAAAPDHQAFAAKLIGRLLGRAEDESVVKRKRRLQVLAVRCALVAHALPEDVRDQVDNISKKLLPPKTMEEAKALSELRDLAVSKLKWRSKRRPRDAACCIRCLSIINTKDALAALGEYRNDQRWTVAEELSRHVEPLSIPLVAEELTRGLDRSGEPTILTKIRRRICSIPPTAFDEKKTTMLDLSGTRISDLKPLSRFVGLKILSLKGLPISDVGALSALSEVTFLDLSDTQVEDIGPLAPLTKLEFIGLSKTLVSNLDALSKAKSLQYVFLGDARVNDVGPLSDLTSITNLSLWGNPVEDISPLSNLKSLKQLDLERTSVSDLTPLASMLALNDLDLSSTQVCDLHPISRLTSLEKLRFFATHVEDISPLSALDSLEELTLWSTHVSDLAPIANLTKLVYLDIDDTQVSDISPLSSLVALDQLYLSHTDVHDLSPLSSLTNLRYLQLNSAPVSSIDPLSNLNSLRLLSLSNTNLTDIEPLAALNKLQSLDLEDLDIESNQPLLSLTSLRRLNLSRTKFQQDLRTQLPKSVHIVID